MVYSEEELIEELRKVSEEHCDGESPTWRKFEDYGSCHPETVLNKFDGWNEAIESADLKPNKEKSRERWSEEEAIEEIRRVSDEKYNGGVPSSSDFSFVSNKFGSWKELLKKSGFDKTRKEKREHGDLDEEVLEVVENLDGYPHLKKVSEEMDIDQGTIIDNISSESWSEFIKKSGFKQELLNEIKRLSGDEPPTLREVVERGEYRRGTYITWFGSWLEAVRECGYDDYWSGELRDRDLGPSWNSSKRKALERDSYRCVNCGIGRKEMGRNPDVHHIMPVRFWDIKEEHEEMNDVSNLISLCPTCHNEYGGMWKECDYEEFRERLGQDSRSIFDF